MRCPPVVVQMTSALFLWSHPNLLATRFGCKRAHAVIHLPPYSSPIGAHNLPTDEMEAEMSDVSQGPGWWQATDGKWYPPERYPGYQPPQVASAQPAYHPPEVVKASDPLEGKGFVRSLYDFSFSSFVTLRVVRVLYVLITIIYSLVALISFVGLLALHKPVDIVLAIVGVPLGYFIYLTVARIMLELLMVVFNIGKDVRAIRQTGEAQSPAV